MTLTDEIIKICNEYPCKNDGILPYNLLLPFEREAEFAKIYGLSVFSQKKQIKCGEYVLRVYRSLDIDELMVF
jgi:hypothetical protein